MDGELSIKCLAEIEGGIWETEVEAKVFGGEIPKIIEGPNQQQVLDSGNGGTALLNLY